MRKILLGILIFCLLIGPVNAPPANEGYGEDRTSLGQFVDVYADLNNVSVTYQVELNATQELIELNWTIGAGAGQENLSTWVEFDPDGEIVVNGSHSLFDQFLRGSDGSVYLDRGAGGITNFSYNFELNVSDIEAGDASNVVMGWAFAVGNGQNRSAIISSEGIGVALQQNGATDDRWFYRLRQRKGGAWSVDILDGTTYSPRIQYCTLSREGTNITLDVYSDAARTTIVEHMTSNAADTDAYQYTLVSLGMNAVGDPNDHWSGSVGDISLGGTPSQYANDGYFSTIDLLSSPDANGSGLAVMVNTTIPTDTTITAQISSDNATWTNLAGGAGGTSLSGGFETFDLRNFNFSVNIYFMFNLSTTDRQVSPYFDQLRLITMIGAGTGAGSNLLNGTWIYYNLTDIANITGIHDDGNLASTYFIDNDTWNCSEVVGVPGYIVKFNGTGVDTEAISLWLVCYVYYDGSASHEINVELWNWTASAYVELGEIPDMLGFDWENFTVYGLRVPNDFLNASGAFVGRFNHADAGNVNHDIYFDRISMLAFVPTGLAVAAGGGDGGVIGFIMLGLISIPVMIFLGVRKR